MSDYKLYFLNETGRIAERVDLEFADDESAVAMIEDSLEGLGAELWRLDVLIKTFPAARPCRVASSRP